MKELFSQKSKTSRGSLYHLKEIFNHRSASAAVMQNYQHVADLVDVSLMIIDLIPMN